MTAELKQDEEGVASTLATLLCLVIALLFIQSAIVAVAPRQQKDAEYTTSLAAIDAFAQLRATAVGPLLPNMQFSVSIPVGTPAASPFSTATDGSLTFDASGSSSTTISFNFVPHFKQGHVTKVDQDILIVMDSSGSMQQNDPGRLRITGAQEYIGRLTYPDRVAIVDFDYNHHLTLANVGGEAHHLYSLGHNGQPDYSDAQNDLNSIDSSGNTNIGGGIQVANDELINNGNPNHAWVEIVLTDGQNNYRWEDDLTRSEAQRAVANNITIYTIGLSDEADAALLTYVATITGGTYYPAPTAASIRWIYYEISRRYQGAIVCGNLWSADAATGSVSLELRNRQYAPQTVRFESGGVSIQQPDGSSIREGFPLVYVPNSGGSGSVSMTLIELVGDPFAASGAEYQFLNARVISETKDDLVVVEVPLEVQAAAIGQISSDVQYYADQGAATQGAAAAVRQLLNLAQASTTWGDANETAGALALAKFNVDQAQSQLSAAIAQVDIQKGAGMMQTWLAEQTKDDIFSVACHLNQWTNWYQGVTITFVSPVASAWVTWFNLTYRNLGPSLSLALSGTTAVITIHAIDQFTLARRVIQVNSS
jgi:hypothetical protein